MKRYLEVISLYLHDKVFLAWMTAGIAFAVLVCLSTVQIINDRKESTASVRGLQTTLDHMDDQLNSLERSIQDDHTRLQEKEDRTWQCIINLFVDGNSPTKDQAEECRQATQTDTDTGSLTPSDASSQSGDNQAASSNNNSNGNSQKPDNSQPQSPTPKESILPFRKDPIIGCPLGVCI